VKTLKQSIAAVKQAGLLAAHAAFMVRAGSAPFHSKKMNTGFGAVTLSPGYSQTINRKPQTRNS